MLSDSYRSFFEQLLSLNCTTGSEMAIGELLAKHHIKSDSTIIKQTVQENRNNIFALSKKKNAKRILFTSHIDTVPPHLNMKHDKDNDCYYGRGACDTKGGIIAQLIAGEELEKADLAIDYLWVVGEETDHIGAKKAVQYYSEELANNYNYKMIILCEPTGMKLAKSQKGILKSILKFSGKQAHSGFPELGIDANREMIRIASLLYSEAEKLEDSDFGSFDINIGMLNGGQAANVISGKAELTFLARTNSNHQKYKTFVNSLASNHLTIELISDYEAINFDYIKSELSPDNYVAKFNTDVVYLSEIAPVYLIGPGDIIHAHSDNEHIFISDIENGVQRYIDLVKKVTVS